MRKTEKFHGRQSPVTALVICFLTAASAFVQAADIDGVLEWDKMEMNAVISLDLAASGIKLPAGRTLGESQLSSEYLKLIRPPILGIQVDSSSTLADLTERGEFSLARMDGIALEARAASPFLSPDLLRLSSAHTIYLENISAALIRHTRPAEIRRTLTPVPAPAYTGIIIIADTPLPVHGMKSAALASPCLFPKIWDTDMNLIYERNMLEAGKKMMVRYAPAESIFTETPSGLSPEIAAFTGAKPMRIIARGLFGSLPTDPVIDTADALAIISTEENRRLLHEGRVLIILADSTLKQPLETGD